MSFKNKKGEGYVFVCVLILVFMMTFSVIFVYTGMITEIRLQKTNTKMVFDSFITKNSILIFNNIKQGNNATEHLETESFYTALKDFCTLDEKDNLYYAVDDEGTEIFHLTKPRIDFVEEDKLALSLKYEMYIPVRFAGHTVTTAEVPIRISSILNSKN